MTDILFPITVIDGSLDLVSKSSDVAISQIFHYLQTVLGERLLSPYFGRNVRLFDAYPSNVLIAEKIRIGLIRTFGDIGFSVTAYRDSLTPDRLTISVKIQEKSIGTFDLSSTYVLQN